MSINEKTPSKILEVCADSAESALTAEKAGALRIELCANLIIGGTTPTIGLVEEVKKAVSIPVNVLIRPRFGDFCYSSTELKAMVRDIRLCRDAGADGIVIGCLKTDGSLDTEATASLIAAAPRGTLSLTLHRAFDMCKDPFDAYRGAAELGFDTILTSGQSASCYEGRTLLAQLNAQRKEGEPVIMAGGGLKPELIVPLAREAGVRFFHLSGKKIVQSPMQWKNPKVSMSTDSFSEYEIWAADATVIRRAREQFDLI
ncbi:copper homeostasis protein CutC [Treponema sp. HNW]|uniref:copper homeostasis protein CutC n=1 Tax=Treponema sp. HNW TaxID=3116654 RepID=UPI003D0F97CB